jgi:hypothetical protein
MLALLLSLLLSLLFFSWLELEEKITEWTTARGRALGRQTREVFNVTMDMGDYKKFGRRLERDALQGEIDRQFAALQGRIALDAMRRRLSVITYAMLRPIVVLSDEGSSKVESPGYSAFELETIAANAESLRDAARTAAAHLRLGGGA